MEKHKEHEFYIIVVSGKYTYFIMDKEVDRKIRLVSDELFESESRARLAAIGHIELLEQGGILDA